VSLAGPSFTESVIVRFADADILIVITPGVERFEYFRHLERIAYGKQPPRVPA
jgi:hypothetical protein